MIRIKIEKKKGLYLFIYKIPPPPVPPDEENKPPIKQIAVANPS